ncbi:MAG: SUMF1/EgtB/PvdO family nonheme iron enzyme [Anaerolineales bacterium]|nr:SUMF1/EgtB/PvdO family nonheme iron enzyme [Anaerolineales bacterium]
MENLTGQYIDRYEILELLGKGGMAMVYKAYDSRLEREVAIKIIRRDAFPPENLHDVLKRFEREAKSLARLSHPNIVKVMDYGEYGDSPFLVLEYLSGGTLKQKIGAPVSWKEAVRLLLPIARGIEYAHNHGVVHRDIKPANILITENGEPMLSDFGIVKVFHGEEISTLTGSGVAIGTPEYMAPEQWTGETGPGSDIYSLGVIFYEMVTGRRPYIADTPGGVFFKQVTEPLPFPREFVPDLPESVERFLLIALAQKPEDRYQSMSEMASVFENLQNDGGRQSAIGIQPKEEKEKQERVAVEKAVQEKEKHNAAEKFKHEKAERQDARRDEIKVFLPKVIPFLRIIGVIGIIIVLFWMGSWVIPQFIPLISTAKDTATHAESSKTFTPVPTGQTKIPTLTSMPTGVGLVTPLSATSTLSLGATQISPVDGMILHYVPAGTFTMGDTAEHASAECQRTNIFTWINCDQGNFKDQEPIHQVYLDAFWMDETEVTNAQYKLCVKASGCQRPSTLGPYYSDDRHGDYPVVFVTWVDANSYCQWSERRLPTEAEWEKAARGTDGRTYPWGEEIGTEYANYNTSPGDVTRVGSYELGKSPYHLYDMAGNVGEWVADLYDPEYYMTLEENVINPQGPSLGYGYVIRGGAFLYNDIQSANRDADDRANRVTNGTGFRCAMNATP